MLFRALRNLNFFQNINWTNTLSFLKRMPLNGDLITPRHFAHPISKKFQLQGSHFFHKIPTPSITRRAIFSALHEGSDQAKTGNLKLMKIRQEFREEQPNATKAEVKKFKEFSSLALKANPGFVYLHNLATLPNKIYLLRMLKTAPELISPSSLKKTLKNMGFKSRQTIFLNAVQLHLTASHITKSETDFLIEATKQIMKATTSKDLKKIYTHLKSATHITGFRLAKTSTEQVLEFIVRGKMNKAIHVALRHYCLNDFNFASESSIRFEQKNNWKEKKLTLAQRHAASIYWTKILTRELQPKGLIESRKFLLPFILTMEKLNRDHILKQLDEKNPLWVTKFMNALDLLLEEAIKADELVSLSINYGPQGLLKKAAQHAGISESLFPTGQLSMQFDHLGQLIVGGEIIDAEHFIQHTASEMTGKSLMITP